MNTFKQQCIALRKKDFTLNEIVEKTGRSKTSVYFHVKDIPLSTIKLKKVKQDARKRARDLATSRKGKSIRTFKVFRSWTPKYVLLVSHLLFDGEIAKARCVYHNRSSKLLQRVEKLMKDIYSFPPVKYHNVTSGVHRVSYYNVALSNFLQKKSLNLLKNISGMPISHKREFVRAFFDDEGCMDFRADRNLRQVRGYQNDKMILELIQRLLADFDIESRLQGKNEVVISGKENLKKFQKEINFSEGVKLNPNRANSIWKKPIEKRVLLDMAIKSFKT